MTTHIDGTDLPNILAGDWKGFQINEGYYLLYLPTMHLLEVDEESFRGALEDNWRAQKGSERLLSTVTKFGEVPARKRVPARIRSIALNVAEQCNLRCAYCYAGEGNYGADSIMDLPMARRVIDFFAAQSDTLQVIFFGGEPLLNYKLIKEVVDYCESLPGKKFSFSMTTNAMLLTKDHLKFFKDHGFSLTISYDGKGIHDRQRLLADKSRGSEVVILKKLELLKEAVSELRKFQIRGTIQAENIALAEEAIADAASSLPYPSMLALAADKTSFAKAKPDLDLILAALRKVSEAIVAGGELPRLRKLTAIWHFIQTLHQGSAHGMTCHAGINYLSVSTSGEFFLCHRFTEDPRGKIGSLDKGLDLDRIAEIQTHRLTKHAPCKDCWMREVCAGGCFHENILANNTAFQADPKFCYLQNGQMELAVELYIKLRQLAPELLDGFSEGFRTEELSGPE